MVLGSSWVSCVPEPCHHVDRNQLEHKTNLLMGSLLVAIECEPAVKINRQVAQLRLVRVQVVDSLSMVVCFIRVH